MPSHTITERAFARRAIAELVLANPGGIQSVRAHWDYFCYLCSVINLNPITAMLDHVAFECKDIFLLDELCCGIELRHNLDNEVLYFYRRIAEAGNGGITRTALARAVKMSRKNKAFEPTIGLLMGFNLVLEEMIGKQRRLIATTNPESLMLAQREKYLLSHL